jgi:hypothetical protein
MEVHIMTYCIGKEECGCEVWQDDGAHVSIIYCNKHEATPDLYEALKDLMDDYRDDHFDTRILLGKQALAKAEVK